MNPEDETRQLLDRYEAFVRRMPETADWLPRIVAMRMRLEQPCVLAVAGRMKAGKSSFLNALLGERLAKVGELETTATINRFCYGEPSDPTHPVKVVWDNGMVTNETLQFMDSMQGHDEETLRKAEGISYLEFRLKHDLLKEITLVDTPGTDAVVGSRGDEHEKVTTRFFRLRQKHQQQTVAIKDGADAVIYLVGAVATSSNKAFLDDFQLASAGASALNALGVLSKVDVDATLLANRHKQADYVANSLRDQLNTVIPVSAGLHMAVKDHEEQLAQWQQRLKTIPSKAFEYLMRQQSIFLTERKEVLEVLYKGSDAVPLPIDERRQMLDDMGWSLFRTIAQVLYNTSDIVEARRQLDDISNMKEVRETIDNLFFNRSKVIRCLQILNELQKLMEELRYRVMSQLHVQSRQADLWIRFVENCAGLGDEETRLSLLGHLKKQSLPPSSIKTLEQELMTQLVLPLEQLKLEINVYDADFSMLKLLQSTRQNWSEQEYDELCSLFGLYGSHQKPPGAIVWKRQAYWESRAQLLADNSMQRIASHAVTIYGKLV